MNPTKSKSKAPPGGGGRPRPLPNPRPKHRRTTTVESEMEIAAARRRLRAPEPLSRRHSQDSPHQSLSSSRRHFPKKNTDKFRPDDPLPYHEDSTFLGGESRSGRSVFHGPRNVEEVLEDGRRKMETSSLGSLSISSGNYSNNSSSSAPSPPARPMLTESKLRRFFPPKGSSSTKRTSSKQQGHSILTPPIHKDRATHQYGKLAAYFSSNGNGSFSSDSIDDSERSLSSLSSRDGGKPWNRIKISGQATSMKALVDDVSARRCAKMMIAVAAAVALATIVYLATGDISGPALVFLPSGSLFKTLFGEQGRQLRYGWRLQGSNAAATGTTSNMVPEGIQGAHEFFHEDGELPPTEVASVRAPSKYKYKRAGQKIPAPETYEYKPKPSIKKSDGEMTALERNRREHLERWKD